MTITRPTRRPGFTLLEVLLASAIGAILLGALYVTLDLTLGRAQAGREAADRGDLARAVVNRMGLDLSAPLGVLPPKSGGAGAMTAASSSSSSGAATGTTGTDAATTPTTGTGTGTATDPGTATGTGTTSEPTPAEDPEATEPVLGADIPFQAGVVGTDKQLTLFTTRVPKGLSDANLFAAQNAGEGAVLSDLARVTYYLAAGGGLARQEKAYVTADGVWNTADPDRSNQAAEILADGVTDVSFEYFDGAGWVTQWDGGQTAADGVTMQGPPRAIRVTFTIDARQADGTTAGKTVQHVFAVRAAGGLYQPPAPAEETTPAPTTSGEGM